MPSVECNLTDVVRELRVIFADDHVDVQRVRKLLRSYKSNPHDWQKYAKFDPARYTRNLLDTGNGKYNVLILCWSEGQGSAIHAHSNSNCFVKVLAGKITESLFKWPEAAGDEQPMKLRKKTTSSVDEETFINDSIGLHRMENLSNEEQTVTLHIYVPAYQECKTFDERSGRNTTCQMVLHNQFIADFAEEKDHQTEQCSDAISSG